MRAKDFITEVSMRPSRLRRMAAQTGAIAGIEFEMVVPNVKTEETDEEPDYSTDEKAYSIDDIITFFDDGYQNSSRDLRELRQKLQEQYDDYAIDQREDLWRREGREYFNMEASGYFDEDGAAEEAEVEAKEEYGTDDLTPEQIKKLITRIVNRKREEWLDTEWDMENRMYDDIKDQWESEFDYPDEMDFLRDNGIRNMSDVESQYRITWPHYTSSESELSIGDVADAFHGEIGRRVVHSDSYHGATRQPNTYVIEPDSSIDADDDDDGGLEFVSPPLPIDEMLSDLNKVIKWAKQSGCYTNDSTGLHMNVSVPAFSHANCDYVKLVLLLGDKYILDQFGRLGNTYAESALDKIKKSIRNGTEAEIVHLMDTLRTGWSKAAADAIHNMYTRKYTSVNVHDQYIEFRSPGGDWLNSDLATLENTLLRFVVALDAACSPTKFRQDYLKKLYQMLNPGSDSDPVAWFAKYSAGEMNKQALVQSIRQLRGSNKQPANVSSNNQDWWTVGINGLSQTVKVQASSNQEAKEKALAQMPQWQRDGRHPAEMYAIVMDMLRQPANAQSNNQDWWTVSVNGLSGTVNVQAATSQEAKERALAQTPEWQRDGRHPAEMNAYRLGQAQTF